MSDTTAIAKKETFIIDMPDNGQPLGFDPTAEAIPFDALDFLAANYFSEEELISVRDSLGGWPVYTIANVTIKPVFDPQDEVDKRDMSPKLVLYFNETSTGCVMNKTRCKQMQEMTGTRDIKRWAELAPPVSLEWGLFNKKAQIGIVPAGEPVYGRQAKAQNGKVGTADGVNEVLFG